MGIETGTSSKVAGSTEHPNSWVYYNGDFRRYHEARVGLMTHALHYGTGVFEGIRAYWNGSKEQLFLLAAPEHFDRLRRSGRIMKMTLPHSTEDLVKLALELLRRNEYRADTYIRPLLFKSSEVIGVRLDGIEESFCIYTAPMGNYVDVDSGIRCMVSSWRRVSDQSLPARGKITGAYANSALAKAEAEENGYDEAIVLTTDGHVSEGSAENLFMYKDGVFVTPPVTDDILEGVTRRIVRELISDELGKQVVERSIDRTELYTCDELFLCGTGAQVSPVIEVDRRPVGDGKIGELTGELQGIYFGAVRGDNPKYSNWSLPVY
ncbi:MAG TPA: branched-chain amino acid transaminase [Candidatus Dormibacteraeota bacterium]|nr:branched-chain amino acid transaminase [Candidatus Dormibacteraeota bacterium]